MFETVKDIGKKIVSARGFMLGVVMVVLFGILIQRIFSLQIVQGADYADKYTLIIEKERTLTGTRGNIYDRNGKLLAYNELAYNVVIEDSGSYSSTRRKNAMLNTELGEVLKILDANNEVLYNNFNIQLNEEGEFEFTVSGTSLLRFLADVYGYTTVDDLAKNRNKLGYSEGEATPDQVIDFLRSDSKFGIRIEGVDLPTEADINNGQTFFSREDAYRILVIRYAMSQNNFQKYIQTTISKDVSDATVATIKENMIDLVGVDIAEDTIRKYENSEYFSHIIGYTGRISQSEYDELVQEDEEYTLTDIIGKSGIEREMETILQGGKGYEVFYVDSMGRVEEIKERTEASAGQDVYLSIDSDLQIAVYDLLEQQIAGIVYSKIENIKEYNAGSGSSASDIVIPIDDVYYALINNNVIDIDAFSQEDASTVEANAYQSFLNRQETVITHLMTELNSGQPSAYQDLTDEDQVYMSYILTMLTDDGILDRTLIDTDDAVYKSWRNNEVSLAEYLRHGISMEWIDITGFETESKYSDFEEIYQALLSYIQEELADDTGFAKRVYRYMIRDELLTGTQICLILFEQGVLEYDEAAYQELVSGQQGPYSFMREKIKNLEITPAQLALDPCTGSCVVTDPQTGELLACVSYPGYDTNRLANTMDTAYYNKLRVDLTSPMYSNATQQQTAPGSTFKPVTAAAALTEGIITTTDVIEDKGVFELVQNGPRCWLYPNGTHGEINVSQAIRDSCNYFFYTLGYNMSLVNEAYQEDRGIDILTTYAEMFGLGKTTGIEVAENEPQISDEYPITSAIGQGNHSYTTSQLARYTTAIASSGTVYQLTLLDKVTEADGTLIQDYGPVVDSTMDSIAGSTWDAIHEGMRMVVEESSVFDGFSESVQVAGKTGTAQQLVTRPNHALFIGYAPYDDPTIVIATRIAYGYTSANAAEVSRNILEYYFQLTDEDELLTGQAQDVGNNTNGFTD